MPQDPAELEEVLRSVGDTSQGLSAYVERLVRAGFRAGVRNGTRTTLEGMARYVVVSNEHGCASGSFEDMQIEELNLNTRPYNSLKREGIHTLGVLTNMTEADLLEIRNFGQKCLEELKEKLSELGISLKKS